ncbi:MAG: DUF4294 domain-containing protein [Bacteroidaceae bacterium]|nr:DUF4294 domain-containing protein [Bacteroidaceae bacterium]
MMLCVSSPLHSQEEDWDINDLLPMGEKEMPSLIKLQYYVYPKPEIIDGDTIWTYLMPELPVYRPIHFRTKREKQKFDKMVYNIKKVLPLAKKVNMMLCETYETLEQLPTKKEKDEHIKRVEKDIKKQYTPIMKKLTLTQGKLLIKLVDRECNQEAFEIVKAFLGPARATFYQIFAWTFKASLKKEYDPEGEDAMIERIVRQIEVGQL